MTGDEVTSHCLAINTTPVMRKGPPRSNRPKIKVEADGTIARRELSHLWDTSWTTLTMP